MNATVTDIIREVGTDECIAEMEAKLAAGSVVTVDTLKNEAPRKTGMRIDPNERYDTRPVVKALGAMSIDDITRRARFILDGGCAEERDEDGRLYQYAILISRETVKRGIKH